METQNLKGWSMKQPTKTPFFKPETGIFILRRKIKDSRIIFLKSIGQMGENKLF
jgi:hypothetical protein